MATTQYRAGYVTLAGCLLIILLSADFFIPMRQLGSFFHIAMNGMAASDKIFRLLDLPEGPDKAAVCPEGDIVCENLTFSYKTDREILHGVNLSFPKERFVRFRCRRERQRLGLARAFLHDAPFLLLDEPTSNLDSLNEAVILKSLREGQEGKTVVSEMIALYCRKRHGAKSILCADCAALNTYARERSDKCPFMETKTFCSNCRVHCYKPEMREKIRAVMRFSGPRMIFYHPVAAVRHVLETKKEKKRLETCNET